MLETVTSQEPPKAEGKCRIVDLRFGNVKAKAKTLRTHYQEEGTDSGYIENRDIKVGNLNTPVQRRGEKHHPLNRLLVRYHFTFCKAGIFHVPLRMDGEFSVGQ